MIPIPLVNEAADGLNAVLYAVEGDYVNVVVSFGAMVPVVGTAATGGKWAKKGVGAASQLGKNVDNAVGNFVKKSDDLVDAGRGGCFTEGTQIVVGMEYLEDEHGNLTTVYTTTNIEDIQVGDYVYSYNTLTGETELAAVTATYALMSNHINYLTIIDEDGNEQVIESTDAHPFWVVTDEPDLDRAARDVVDENGVVLYHENLEPGLNGFWVEAKDLQVGDVFLGAKGELSTLTNIVRVEQSGGITVFNFTVEGNHNYFIIAKEYDYGQSCVLVHNAGYKKGNGTAAANRAENIAKGIPENQIGPSGQAKILKVNRRILNKQKMLLKMQQVKVEPSCIILTLK